MDEDKDLKGVLTEHFDIQASSSNKDNNLKKYGSLVNDPYLRSPYAFIEENYLSDISNKKVLDYCCGTGIYSIFPALKGAYVFGVDISEQSIKIAKSRAARMGLKDKCDFLIGDAEFLDYKDNSFDIVLSYGSLSYLNLEEAFKEIKRVLNPEGIFIAVDSLGHNPLFNINRKRNILKYAPEHYSDLRTLKITEIGDLSNKFFSSLKIFYFDFFSVFGYCLQKYFKIQISPNLFTYMDKQLSRIPLLRKFFFKAVFVFK